MHLLALQAPAGHEDATLREGTTWWPSAGGRQRARASWHSCQARRRGEGDHVALLRRVALCGVGRVTAAEHCHYPARVGNHGRNTDTRNGLIFLREHEEEVAQLLALLGKRSVVVRSADLVEQRIAYALRKAEPADVLHQIPHLSPGVDHEHLEASLRCVARGVGGSAFDCVVSNREYRARQSVAEYRSHCDVIGRGERVGNDRATWARGVDRKTVGRGECWRFDVAYGYLLLRGRTIARAVSRRPGDGREADHERGAECSAVAARAGNRHLVTVIVSSRCASGYNC